jgi:hypothetical protein
MKNDRPKLFGLIMQHLNAESKDEISIIPDHIGYYKQVQHIQRKGEQNSG